MKTQAAVIASDPVYLTWLKETLGAGVELNWIRPGDAAEPVPAQLLSIEQLELVFVEADMSGYSSVMLEELADSHPHVLIIAIGADSPTQAVIEAMRAGARDFFVMGRDDQELSERLRKLMRKTSQLNQANDRAGRIFSIHSATGGPALAWTAEHLALSLQETCRPGDKVLLIDLATPHGASLVFLNIAQSYSLLDAVQDVYRCDQTLIDTAFSKHVSGLHVLAMPEDQVEPARLDDQDFLSLLDVLSKHFHSIVLCTGANLAAATLAGVISRAHASFVLSDGSILNSRANKHLIRALRLEDVSLERLGMLVDSDGIARGLDARGLAKLLELPLWGVMPVNFQSRLQAMNAGEPLFTGAPKDAYCAEMRGFAKRLIVQDAKNLSVQDEKRGLLKRMFGD
ncbi:MAG: AAA family ATPase [Oceanococcus sp.]